MFIVTSLYLSRDLFLHKLPENFQDFFDRNLEMGSNYQLAIIAVIISILLFLVFTLPWKTDSYELGLSLILFHVFFAPLFEEILYRGLFGGGTSELLSFLYGTSPTTSRAIATIFSVFCFVIAHNLFKPERILQIIISGIFYMILYWRSEKNILPSFLAHGTRNLLVLLF